MVRVLSRARSFDFSTPLFDNGLVLCVRGWVAPVQGVVDGSAEGFSCAVDTGGGGFEVRQGALFGEGVAGAIGCGAIWIVCVLDRWLLVGDLGDA